jgi:DNA-binding MarR family transcriptional regulator
MSYTKTGKAFTDLVLEIFRFNGQLLSAGEHLTKPLKLSSARWQVLGAIERAPLPVSQIARNIGLTRQSVQRLTDILEPEGIVEYAANPDHKRAKLVCLTKRGAHAVKELGRYQIRWANQVANGVKSEEISAAFALIKKLRLRLETS